MKILVVVGHPRPGSFSDALASAFAEGARDGGADVRVLNLRELHFDPNVFDSPSGQRSFEPDLEASRESIVWCDRLVLVYPTWWAGVPSLLKGFLDRVLTSGFAFEETTGGTGYRGLLEPRSAQLVTTMDTPWWVYRWIYGRPGELAMKRGTLGFCGFSPVRSITLSPVKSSTPEVRANWLKHALNAGRCATKGPTRLDRCWAKTRVWLLAMRLQFYPMTFLAYSAVLCNSSCDLVSWNSGSPSRSSDRQTNIGCVIGRGVDDSAVNRLCHCGRCLRISLVVG